MISSKHYTLYTKIKITFLANHLAISIKSITFAAAISAKPKKSACGGIGRRARLRI